MSERARQRLESKVVIVTGGSMGIGEAIARGCASEGARVAITARGRQAGEAVAAEICASGGEAVYFEHDVASDSAWRTVIDGVLERWGQVDGLVNNAGRGVRRLLPEMSTEEFMELNRLNLYSVFVGTTRVAAAMGRRGGAVVNIGSTSCFQAITGGAAYAASKAAVLGFSRSCRGRARPSNLRVHTIMPGRFRTAIMAQGAPPEQREAEARANPMRRFGDPVEIAEPVIFLLSDAARLLDGVELVINGGAAL